MNKENKQTNNRALTLLAVMFSIFTIWWLAMIFSTSFRDKSTVLLSEVYGLVALSGGLYGLSIAKGWGSFKSTFGRAIIFLSIGLMLQEFGQLAYSYLNSVKHVEVPYPSWPDIGFFGSIPMYFLATANLAKGLGVTNLIKKKPQKLLIGIIVPAAILAVTYWFFLKGYSFTDVPRATVFFDFAYPLGQAIYVSFALVALLCVGRLLGGVMKKPVLLLFLALAAQYSSDFNYLYQTHHETWGPARYGDYLYFISYCIMWLSLIKLNSAFGGKNNDTENEEAA